MLFKPGLCAQPGKGQTRPPNRFRPGLCAALPGLFGFAAIACGQGGLTLAEAERLALEAEPGQAALFARAAALTDQAAAAAELPDPKLRVGLANFPLERGGFAAEAMTQAQVGFQQMFPPGASREISARRFGALASELTEQADARGREVLAGVRAGWLDAWYWDRAEEIVSEVRPFFADLVTVTRSLYAVGRRDQQDVLRSELELSRIDERLIDIGWQRSRARAELRRWLPDLGERRVATVLPPWQVLPPLDVLRENLAAHPVLRAADAGIDAREAGIDLAREQFRTGWSLDVGYGYRDGRQLTGERRSDLLSVGVMLDMPWFRTTRRDRNLAAALSERRAAAESREVLRRALASELEAAHSRWEEITRRLELYESRIIDQTGDRAEAALLAYQSEAGDFADVMLGTIDQLNVRLDYLRLQVERARSFVTLANLGGLLQ